MTTEISIAEQNEIQQPAERRAHRLLFPGLFLLFELTFILLKAILPLHGNAFQTADLRSLGEWILQPSRLLFPGDALSSSIFGVYHASPPPRGESALSTLLLLGAFSLIFLAYMLLLRYLPRTLTRRSIFAGALILGLTCAAIPVVTSPDLYSYIIYARMQVFYHLNPLTTIPLVIKNDPTFVHLYWIDQPSAYGPSWLVPTSALQWLLNAFGLQSVTAMVLGLRLLGLAAHLGSTLLVWLISGHLLNAQETPERRKLRMGVLLAFAWNPLLLFEACVNAHNDTAMLFCILLALWVFLRAQAYRTQPVRTAILTAFLLAVATCLKVNVGLLIPGMLLFLWLQPQRRRTLSAFLLTYGLTALLLYLPYWAGPETLNVLRVNPGTYRTINTVADFLVHFYNTLAQRLGFPAGGEIGSPAESVIRVISIAIFALCYLWLCWRTLVKAPLRTPVDLLKWLALTWLLYCAIGTPWFWPWYLVTFFGLYALVEASGEGPTSIRIPLLGELRLPLAVHWLSFSMLSIYCFYTWVPLNAMIPKLPNFRWSHLRGLWAWLLPLLALRRLPFLRKREVLQEE